VTFAPVPAHSPAPRGNLGVKVWPFFSVSSPPPRKKRAVEDAEARQVVNIIQEHLPAVEAAERKKQRVSHRRPGSGSHPSGS